MDTQQTMEWNRHPDEGSVAPEDPARQQLQDTADAKLGFQRLNAASCLSDGEHADGAIASAEASAPETPSDAKAMQTTSDPLATETPIDALATETPNDAVALAAPSPNDALAGATDAPAAPTSTFADSAEARSPEPLKDVPDLAKASPETGGSRKSAADRSEVGSPELLECKVGLRPSILCPNSKSR